MDRHEEGVKGLWRVKAFHDLFVRVLDFVSELEQLSDLSLNCASILQIFPLANISTGLTIFDESSPDHPKGCYIQKDEKDLTKFIVAFNIPPENSSWST